jgi:DNA-binding NtrC family response regulator
MLSVLIVDDEPSVRETLVDFFESRGHMVRGAASATAARQAAAEHSPDVALVDLRLPDADGLRLLEVLRADHPDVAVIFLTGHGDVATAVRAMREGAADFLEKPVDLDALDASVRRAAEHGRLRREVNVLRAGRAGALWADVAPEALAPALAPTFERLVELAARNDDAPVLVTGETGTGKGYVARRIHELSARRAHPFVEINCASLSAQFVESELFGHEKGAFTDAKQAKRGLLEVAGRGTVLLDEVAELAPEVQPKLLKVIEEHTFRRLGGTALLTNDARVIVATHVPLAQAAAERRFRADLLYRLQVLTIELPPLRARRGEIRELAVALAPRGVRLSDAALGALTRYDWPGNVRELKNTLWRASILAEGAPIGPEHLGLPGDAAARPAPAGGDEVVTLADAERRAITAALARTGGNKARAAELLGIARSTLNEKLRRLEPTA